MVGHGGVLECGYGTMVRHWWILDCGYDGRALGVLLRILEVLVVGLKDPMACMAPRFTEFETINESPLILDIQRLICCVTSTLYSSIETWGHIYRYRLPLEDKRGLSLGELI